MSRKSTLSKAENELLNRVHKTVECLNNRLTLENIRLSESYVKGEIYILVCFIVSGNVVKQRALFHRKDGLICWEVNRLLFDSVSTKLDKSRSDLVEKVRADVDLDLFGKQCHNHQQIVLVDNVKSVESIQCVIPSTVRFEGVYSLFNRIRDSLCFSLRFGSVLLGTLADREVGMGGRLIPVVLNQPTCKVIQCGSEVVDSISGDQRYDDRDIAAFVKEVKSGGCFTIEIGRAHV